MPRRQSTDDDISLFPFLSIIASVIGVLTMMIATIALSQTDTPDVALIEKHEQIKQQLDRADEELEKAKREISVSHAAALQLREKKQLLDITLQELEMLLKELEKVEKELAEQQKVKVIIPQIDPKMRETLADMQAQQQQLVEAIAQLEKELSDRQDRAEARVTILPQGSGRSYQPFFVECAADSLVLHHLPEPKRIRTAEIVKDPDFIKLLEVVANSKDGSIIFLIRNDGLATYRTAKKICDDRELRSGKIPVVGKGRIDLSVFAQATSVNGGNDR
jgi:hypothetical protein